MVYPMDEVWTFFLWSNSYEYSEYLFRIVNSFYEACLINDNLMMICGRIPLNTSTKDNHVIRKTILSF